MSEIPTAIRRKILYILHCGLTDIRDRALGTNDKQISDLADALEILPGILDRWSDDRLEMVDFVLKNYQELHPKDRFRLYDRFSNNPAPEHF